MPKEDRIYYQSQTNGYVLPLPSGKSIVFDTQKKIIKEIEESKAFKLNRIFKAKSPMQLREDERMAEAAQFVENLKATMNEKEMITFVGSKDKDNLFEFANRVGVSVYD